MSHDRSIANRGVAVLGEALVDLMATGDVAFEARAGGSPANIAVAAARLGLPTWFLGGVSTDRWGRLLADHLAGSGVVTQATPRNHAPTAMALVDLDDGGAAQYRFLWQDTADRVVTMDDLPADLEPAAWLQVGSVAAAFEDSGTVAADLVRRERPRRLVSCDPNVRTIAHGTSGPVRTRLVDLTDQADLVKASDEDLGFLLGHQDVDVALQRWLSGGAGVVAITRGGHGAELACPAGRISVPIATATVVDTVGAGDTFMAGLVVGLSDAGVATRDQLHEIDLATLEAVGRFAAAAAAITVGRVGADPPRRDDLPADVARL